MIYIKWNAVLSLQLAVLMSASSLFAVENFTETRARAERGDAGAQFDIGAMYYNGDDGVPQDAGEGVKWWRKAAEQKNARAQFALGIAYEDGNGVTKDLIQAVKWWRKAAEQGDISAQFLLAERYKTGDGVTKNLEEAVKWYREAAEQGHALSQNTLGVAYAEGEGVPKDEIEALAWFTLTAASGDLFAVANRNESERRLGRQATLIAQQRSKEIRKEIESKQRARASVTAPSPLLPPGTNHRAAKSSGTGTIISVSGYVLTAAHVVAGGSSISVRTVQGTKTAEIVRIDKANDLALLKINDGSYAALPVGPSKTVRLGQAVATIGFPNVEIQGFSPKLTRGEISSLNGIADDPRTWQISAPVQPGNSGGPLLDVAGNLIGVVVAKLGLKAAEATGDLPQNVGYAVKSAYVFPLLKPYLGNAPEANHASEKTGFEDMVAKAQQSIVLIIVY